MPKRTGLFDLHTRLGARMVEFSGWEMPVQYSSVLEEHKAVRERVGVFDVSHMSNLWVTGPEAEATLSRSLVANASKIPVQGTKYTCALEDDGSIIDDLYVFHHPRGYHLVPNASRNGVVAARLRSLGSAEVADATESTAILAVQGPHAQATLAKAIGRDLRDIPRFHLTQAPEWSEEAFISRTGYTGEDGFEIFLPMDSGKAVFSALVDAGATPCGLGARDTLRLEKGYALAGNEFAGGRTPLEAGLGWLVQWDHDFAGKPALEKQKSEGGYPKLVGLKAKEKGIPRHGNPVLKDGERAGEVTSGSMSPSLGVGIALAYLRPDLAKPGMELAVDVRGKPLPAQVVKLPFL